MALVAEVPHQGGCSQRARPASRQEITAGRHLRQPDEELLRVTRRADLGADAPFAGGARAVAMHRSGRDLHDLPGHQPVPAAREPRLERARQHLEPLDLAGVQVGLGEKAARPPDHVELEHLAGRLVGLAPDLDSDAE